jgi:hypothetical protein
MEKTATYEEFLKGDPHNEKDRYRLNRAFLIIPEGLPEAGKRKMIVFSDSMGFKEFLLRNP